MENHLISQNNKNYIFETKLFHNFKKLKREGGLRTKRIFKKSSSSKPLITIITVVKNNSKTIKNCIKSVINQNYSNIEHVIIDGGSSDNTVSILKKYSNHIDYWISEKDNGLYDAMNKGLKLSQGEYIGILNSDDTYKKNSLNIILKYFKKFKNIDFVFGTVFKGRILSGFWPKKILWKLNIYSAHSVGFFIKKNSQKKIGFYDTKFKYCADRDLFYRMIVKAKMKGKATNKKELIGYFTEGGFSESLNFIGRLLEETRIRLKNKQNIILVIILFFVHLIYQLRKFFIK